MALRRATATAPSRPLTPKLPTQPPGPEVDGQRADQLCTDILQFLTTQDTQAVKVRAEVGRLLLDLKSAVPYGAWGTFVAARLPFTSRSAQRAINLYRFREKDAPLFEQLAPLGVSKANVLITLPVSRIKGLIGKTHRVASTGAQKSLVVMTQAEMMGVLSSPTNPTEPSLVSNCQRTSRKLTSAINALIAQRSSVDPSEAADIYNDLVHLVSRLASAFDLER